jgi:molybdate transport system substrate-binding protein
MLKNPIVRIVLAILVLTVFLGACVLGPMFYDLGLGASDDTAEITVAVAASSLPVFERIADAFEEEFNAEVSFTSGSTEQLAQQIESGAPVDIFVSADIATVERLDEGRWIVDDSTVTYARGSLVLWTRGDHDLEISSIEDLNDSSIERIAIANPAYAPYGIAAREALETAGLWDALEDRIIPTQNVRAALETAATGNADVAIVARSLAMESDDGEWVDVPGDLHDPIDQAMAVVVRTTHEDAARTFIEFATSPEGRALLEDAGFADPGDDIS